MIPDLRIHDRSKVLRSITAVESGALVTAFGAGGTRPDESAMKIAEDFLRWLRDHEYWLACSCRDPDKPPLMAPRWGSNHLHIVRHGSVEHDPACLMRMTSIPCDVAQGTQLARPSSWSGPIVLLQEASPNPAVRTQPSQGQGGATRSSPYSRYERLLEHLIETAQINVLVVKPHDRESTSVLVKERYAAFDLLNDLQVAGDVTWKQVVCRHLQHLTRHAIRLRQASGTFPVGTRPQGYFFGVIDDIKAVPSGNGRLLRRRFMKDGQEQLAEKIVRGISGAIPQAGPYLVLGAIGSQPNQQFFDVLHAHAIGLFNKRDLLPVRTDIERTLLRGLTRALQEIGADEHVAIERPMDLESANELWLWIGARRIKLNFSEGDASIEVTSTRSISVSLQAEEGMQHTQLLEAIERVRTL